MENYLNEETLVNEEEINAYVEVDRPLTRSYKNKIQSEKTSSSHYESARLDCPFFEKREKEGQDAGTQSKLSALNGVASNKNKSYSANGGSNSRPMYSTLASRHPRMLPPGDETLEEGREGEFSHIGVPPLVPLPMSRRPVAASSDVDLLGWNTSV